MGTSVNANGIAGEVQDLAVPGIVLVQTGPAGHNPNTTSSGPFTVTATISNPPVAGNELFLFVGGANYTAFSATSWAGSPGWTWDKVSSDADVAVVGVARIISDGVTTSFTITGTPGAVSADMWGVCCEVSGLRLNPLAASTSSLSAATATTGTVSLAADVYGNAIAFIVTAVETATQPTVPTWSNGFANLFTGDTGSTATDKTSLFVGYQIYTTISTPSTVNAWTTSGSASWAMVSYNGLQQPAAPQLVATQTIVTSSTRH